MKSVSKKAIRTALKEHRAWEKLVAPDFIPIEFENSLIEAFDFTKKNLSSSVFKRCKFVNCNFSNCNLDGCDFGKSQFENCDFSGATLDLVNATYANFINCKIAGASFSSADLHRALLISCDLSGSEFRQGTDAQFARFNNSNLDDTIWDNVLLRENSFMNASTNRISTHNIFCFGGPSDQSFFDLIG